MPKINVLLIIPALGFGGAETQLVTLAENLDRSRYATTVCCLRHHAPVAEMLARQGVEVVNLHWRTRYLPLGLYRLVRLMRNHEADIVHTHLFDAGLWGRIAAKLAGVPIVINTEHGLNLWKKRYHIWFERIADRFTDRRIAVSEDIRRSRIRREGLNPEKIVIIHNFIDLAFFDPNTVEDATSIRKDLGLDDSEQLVGTVARLSHVKGVAYFLRAAEMISQTCPGVRFIIVGDGPLRDDLEHLAAQLGLRERVVFAGTRSDVRELLAAMDVFVLASIREGIPVSLLEAMAMKRAVVATAVGGTPEVVQNDRSGILVPSQDARALAEAVVSLLKDSRRRTALGEAGRERVREAFSADACVGQLERLYEEVLEQKGGRL